MQSKNKFQDESEDHLNEKKMWNIKYVGDADQVKLAAWIKMENQKEVKKIPPDGQ